MIRLWNFLLTLFWIKRLDQLVQERQRAVFRLLRLQAWFFMTAYLFLVAMSLTRSVIELDPQGALGAAIALVFFPLAYRLVMAPLIGFWKWWQR